MNEKIVWADNLRAFATISVILLHVASSGLYLYGSVSTTSWMIGNIYDGVVRYCVPFFLMLTGALLYAKPYRPTDFFKKRFLRIVIPFLFWSCIYIINVMYTNWSSISPTTCRHLIKTIYFMFKDGASYHLWYIYMLIGIYMIFPIIKRWLDNATKQEIRYYLIVWFVVTTVSMPYFELFKTNIDVRYFSGYLGYTIVGYYLTAKINYVKTYIPLLLFAVGTGITVVGTYIQTKTNGHFYESFYDFLSPNVIMASVGLFLIIKNIEIRNKILNKIISIVSKYSYGIYLSHVIVLIYLTKAGIHWSYINPIVGSPLTTVICLILSLLLTWLISKLPFGKYISG